MKYIYSATGLHLRSNLLRTLKLWSFNTSETTNADVDQKLKEPFWQKIVHVNNSWDRAEFFKWIIFSLNDSMNENRVTYLTGQHTMTYAYGKIDGDTRIIRYKKFLVCSYQEKSYI